MRIAIEASTWINPRGYGRFTRECIRALLRRRSPHSFTLVLDSGAAAADDLPDCPRLAVSTRRSVDASATSDSSRSLADLWRMSAALSSRRFDAVIFPTSYSFVPVRPGPSVLIVIHDALPETMPKQVLGSRSARVLWGLKSRLACWRADHIATVSRASADAIRAHLPVGSRPITVLTEGAAAVFSPQGTPGDHALVARCLPHAGRFILYVGGQSVHKRVPELIRAFGRLKESGDHQDVFLVLAGPAARDGFEADREGVAAALADIGAHRQAVVQTGFVSDATLAALYRFASVTVLPSAAEGFGLPAIEAMASGCPLAATRNPALEEVCGDAAEYVDDPRDLPQALALLLGDAGRRAERRARGLARANCFGWDECADRLLRHLGEWAA